MSKPQPIGSGKQQEQKLQKRSYFGFERQNLYDYIKSSSVKLINFLISPMGIGKISSLRFKLEHIIGSIFDEDCPEQINPCFDYIIQKLIYMELINNQKKTEYILVVSSEMVGEFNNEFQEKIIKQKVGKIISQWQKDQNTENYFFKKEEERIYRLKKYHEKMATFRTDLQTNLTKYFKEKRQKIKKKLSSTQQYFFSKPYIEELIRNIDNIQTLRITHQFNKYSIFERRYKHYFQTVQIPSQKKKSPPYFHVKVNRPSNEIQPLLQTVTDLVRMREKKENYRTESINLVIDIFEQIKKYQQNINEQRVFYEYLNPSNIIFDQISLMPKLSNIPLLNNLFGLTNQPMSIQDRIVFAPTPRSFDYFKSFPEIDRTPQPYKFKTDVSDPIWLKTKYMLNDPFYGNEEMHEGDKHRLSNKQLDFIRQQKKQISRLKETIVSWRYLLTSYYLIQSQQFGFAPNLHSTRAQQQYFYEKMKEANERLLKDTSYISNFLGVDSLMGQRKPFHFTQSEICDFLQIQNEDSVVESNKYVMVKKYFQIRNEIIKEFIRLLVNNTIFGRIFNIKKYIFIYFTIAIEILEESKRFIKAERCQPRQRRKMRTFLQKQLKRMKSDKNYYAYLQTTYQKIYDYVKRDPKLDHQAKFALQQDIGKKSMIFVNDIKQTLKDVEKYSDQLTAMEETEKFSEQEKKKYNQVLNSLDEIINKNLSKLKAIMNEFIFNQLRLKHRDGPHRTPQNASKSLKQAYQMYTTRLQLLSLTYISLSEQNFLTYNSLVFPQFRIDETDKKIDLVNLSKENALQPELNSLKIVADVIESAKLLPKQMTYFTSNKQSFEWHIPLKKSSMQQTRK